MKTKLEELFPRSSRIRRDAERRAGWAIRRLSTPSPTALELVKYEAGAMTTQLAPA